MPTRAPAPLLLVALATGCLAPGDAPDDPPTLGAIRAPALTGLERVCAQDVGRWTVDADADAWAGALVTWWTDGEVVERHRFGSVEAAADGSWDRLRGELDIVGDWREVEPGRSTVFRCGQPTAMLAWLEDLAGERVDCAVLGDRALFAGSEGVPACPGEG